MQLWWALIFRPHYDNQNCDLEARIGEPQCTSLIGAEWGSTRLEEVYMITL